MVDFFSINQSKTAKEGSFFPFLSCFFHKGPELFLTCDSVLRTQCLGEPQLVILQIVAAFDAPPRSIAETAECKQDEDRRVGSILSSWAKTMGNVNPRLQILLRSWSNISDNINYPFSDIFVGLLFQPM